MKKITLIFVSLILLLSVFIFAEAEMNLAAENEYLALYVDEATLEMKVLDKASGREYSTKIMNGSQGNKTTKNNEKSDARAYYIVNEFVGTTNSMDSYSMSVAYNNFDLSYIENGIEVAYEIGDMTISVEDLPKMVPVDKYYEKLLPYWTSKNDEDFREFYRIVRETQWVRTDDGKIGKIKLENLYHLFYDTAVYTKEDLEADNAAYGYEITNVNPKVNLKLRFTLDGTDLVVTMPCGEITNTPANPVTRVDLLPYFMTATKEDEGYIFVPDGSGSLIYLNNGKTTALSYTDRVYGSDPLMNVQNYSAPVDSIELPVYGIKTRDGAVMAIIEQGAEIASLYADISDRSDEFNRVYSYFTIRDIEFVTAIGTATGSSPRYPTDIYTGDVVLRYKFLSGEEANYVGMAHAYRDYLKARGMLAEAVLPEDAPFFAELVGAVRKTKFFVGIPYESTAEATTLKQAAEIADALSNAGVRNLNLIMNGCFEGGIKHESLSRLSLESSLGGKKDLAALKEAVASAGGKIYFMMNAEKVYSTDHFRKSSQASRRQDNFTASVSNYAEPILSQERGYTDSFYVSPLYLNEYAEKIDKNLRSSAISDSGIAIDDLGNLLLGDYRNGDNVSRIHATARAEKALDTLTSGRDAMLKAPNVYALKYASTVYGLPSAGNGHKVEDEDIPFIQLVLDGSYVYTSGAWNEAAYTGMWRELNYAVETRSAPYFRLTYESEQVFLHTEDKDSWNFFMTEYTGRLNDIEKAYAAYNDFWQQTKDAEIAAHEILASGLRRVTYDNGVTVYVNYNSVPMQADGITVPAQGYLVSGGAAK